MAVPLEFHTARLVLRRLTAAHVDDLVELDSDPQVMRYINGGLPVARETYDTDILRRMTGFDDHPYGFFAVEEGGRFQGQFQGWFHLRPSVADASVLELGYRLRRAAWGRGLATEAAHCLLAHAFDTLGEAAVDACAHPDNAASIAVMRKCGMRFVGTFMHPRVPLEVVRYLVDRDTWSARSPA